jgi:hypothetical protein
MKKDESSASDPNLSLSSTDFSNEEGGTFNPLGPVVITSLHPQGCPKKRKKTLGDYCVDSTDCSNLAVCLNS